LPIVTVRSAVCVLGQFPALAGADLSVETGEILLLAGPNGAGKTTLLRLLAGLVPLRSGSATVMGFDLALDRRSHRRRLALIGHETFCYDDLTVIENLRFAARAAGARDEAANVAATSFGLGAIADVRHARLSAGQRRRLALAVAFAREPELLLLDEPHAGLDATGRDLLDSLLQQAVARNVTVLIASHELDRTRALATREVTVDQGVIRDGAFRNAQPVKP
jgi:heme ABC exporter ATP-binding subunit CcmA